jgi:hypothetical protein
MPSLPENPNGWSNGKDGHTFSGKKRPVLTKVCACGCGQKFKTTFPDKTTKNDAHRKRLSRKMSQPVT